ncbi:hypothetical protein Scep_007622 [Stephania cephalantha]|uniref:Uncharacterized protein n=1 Tax=Stephania cephalantha TaxID=152367 RepID=A0AAP0KBH9_9MAGN
MVEDWISQENTRQRKSRVGGVKSGFCFCLYTQHRYKNLMRLYQFQRCFDAIGRTLSINQIVFSRIH